MSDFATNPRARHDYEILETIEAGVVLRGFEAKAVRAGKVSLRGSYVKVLNGIPTLVGVTISPYQEGNTPADYDPQASRALLLSKRQIAVLIGVGQTRGLTLVPLKLYPAHGRIKLLVGIGRGKKKYDKREAIKKKDVARARQRGTYEG